MLKMTVSLCTVGALLLLMSVLLIPPVCAFRQKKSYTHYVMPNFPVNSSCAGNPDDKNQCWLLDNYLHKQWDASITLTLVFVKGSYVSITRASHFLNNLILFGDAPTHEIVLKQIFLSVKDPENIFAENLTVEMEASVLSI